MKRWSRTLARSGIAAAISAAILFLAAGAATVLPFLQRPWWSTRATGRWGIVDAGGSYRFLAEPSAAPPGSRVILLDYDMHAVGLLPRLLDGDGWARAASDRRTIRLTRVSGDASGVDPARVVLDAGRCGEILALADPAGWDAFWRGSRLDQTTIYWGEVPANACLVLRRWWWVALPLVALPTVIVAWRSRPRAPGACPGCGYDLRGLAGDVCPECGRVTLSAALR